MKQHILPKLIILFLTTSICFGDGFHVGRKRGNPKPIPEPKQKAIINWDGTTETMLLSSYVKLNELEDFAWIVPILSSEVPQISKGDNAIFKQLHTYMHPPKKYSRKGSGIGFGGGKHRAPKTVTVIAKDIAVDYFDITILKATNAKDLIKWLYDNEYSTTNIKEKVLSHYTNQDDCFFVINKIDLIKSFSEEIDPINRQFEKHKMKLLNPHKLLEKRLNKELKSKDIKTEVTLDSLDSWQIALDGYYLRREFHKICLEYINSSNNPLQLPINPKTQKPYIASVANSDLSNWYFDTLSSFGELVQSDNSIFSSCLEYKQWMLSVEKQYLTPISNHYSLWYRELVGKNHYYEHYIKRYDVTSNNIKPRNSLTPEKDPQKQYNLLEKLSYLRNNPEFQLEFSSFAMRKLYNTLKGNLSTPLLFSFKPRVPYFPLYISSMGTGKTDIRVYVISETESIAKEVLKKGVSKRITKEYLKLQLHKNLKCPIGPIVTEFNWGGKLQDLKMDAFFIPHNPSPGKGLFSTITIDEFNTNTPN